MLFFFLKKKIVGETKICNNFFRSIYYLENLLTTTIPTYCTCTLLFITRIILHYPRMQTVFFNVTYDQLCTLIIIEYSVWFPTRTLMEIVILIGCEVYDVFQDCIWSSRYWWSLEHECFVVIKLCSACNTRAFLIYTRANNINFKSFIEHHRISSKIDTSNGPNGILFFFFVLLHYTLNFFLPKKQKRNQSNTIFTHTHKKRPSINHA